MPTLTAHARHTDRDTSHAAAASVKDIRASQSAVLYILSQFGPRTDEHLIETYKDIQTVRKAFHLQEPLPVQSDSGIRTRRAELVRLGKVRQATDANGNLLYSTTASGRRACVWEVAA